MVFVAACKNAQAEPLDGDRIGRPWFVLMGGGGELRWVMVGWESPPQRLRITGGGPDPGRTPWEREEGGSDRPTMGGGPPRLSPPNRRWEAAIALTPAVGSSQTVRWIHEIQDLG